MHHITDSLRSNGLEYIRQALVEGTPIHAAIAIFWNFTVSVRTLPLQINEKKKYIFGAFQDHVILSSL